MKYSWYFNFNVSPPCTNHPSYKDRLARGRHNVILVDGLELDKSVKEFMTGEFGWVRVCGCTICNRLTHVVDKETGNVYHPQPARIIDRDNEKTYPEEATYKIFGNVQYIDTRVEQLVSDVLSPESL